MVEEWNTGWPTWDDDGKLVEILTESGDRVVGGLHIEDTGSYGDGEEYPIWAVIDHHGAEHSFAFATSWRFYEVVVKDAIKIQWEEFRALRGLVLDDAENAKKFAIWRSLPEYKRLDAMKRFKQAAVAKVTNTYETTHGEVW